MKSETFYNMPILGNQVTNAGKAVKREATNKNETQKGKDPLDTTLTGLLLITWTANIVKPTFAYLVGPSYPIFTMNVAKNLVHWVSGVRPS